MLGVMMMLMIMKLLKGTMITENDNDDYPRFLTEMGTDGLTHQSFKRCLTVGRLRLINRKKIEFISFFIFCASSILLMGKVDNNDKGRCPKKTGKCGNFEEKKQGGGFTRIPLPFFFTVFNMGDLPKINGKIGNKFPNRGEGGVP